MKRIKILFWKLLQWYNDINIKMSLSDLKLFEKRGLIIEKHLKNLSVDYNYGLDNFEEKEYIKHDIELTRKCIKYMNDDISNSYPEALKNVFDKNQDTNIYELIEERIKAIEERIKAIGENKIKELKDDENVI